MALYTIVRNADGNQNAPYLIEYDGKVVFHWYWLDNDWNSNNPALRFANLFVSKLSYFYWRVLFFMLTC